MNIITRIFFWASLLSFLTLFTARSNAFVIVQHIPAAKSLLNPFQVSVPNHANAVMAIHHNDTCFQDADDTDTDDHTEENLFPATLFYLSPVFQQKSTSAGYQINSFGRPAFISTLPRYILFHSLIIPPSV